MKAHYAVLLALVLGVGCGEKEPELRSEKVITPDEAANELFVEAVELVSEAQSNEATDIPAAIKSYEQALVKVRKIVNEYKKSDLAVKLVSGETLFTGKSMKEIEERVGELTRRAEEKSRAEEMELARQAEEEKRQAEEKSRAEEMRRTEEIRRAEESRQAEEKRKATQDAIVEQAFRKALNMPTGKLTKADLTKITEINLSYTKITDAGLKKIAEQEKLTDLYLSGTQITDAGLKEVAKLEKLTSLGLFGCKQITNAGLKELAKLNKLTYLNLIDTKIIREEIAKLQKALPKCKIHSNPTN